MSVARVCGRACAALLSLAMLLARAVPAALPAALPAGSYDADLCVTAQRLLLNAPDIPVRVQSGTGNGFHTIQMSVDEEARGVVVAMTSVSVEADGGALPTHVACKMVDRERVNDVLNLDLPGPARRCREVNEYTHQQALAALSAAERARYLAAGRPLAFVDDALIATGGEWLPLAIDDYIRPAADGRALEIAAPTVRVPWDAKERGFFQGTRHCKLVTLAVMQRWMRSGAFDPGEESLFPRTKRACDADANRDSVAGSCLFYFAPADSLFCADYSGPGWTGTTARAECGQRHASRAALQAARNRYEGSGGAYSGQACADRPDQPPVTGTCVFNCSAPDETRWRVSGPANVAMSRACDLYLPGK